MGLFCTTTSLETLWVGGSFANLTALASDLIGQAEDEIRKKMSKRYDVSTDDWQTTTGTVPPMVTTWCEWLSLGYLYEASARGGNDTYKRADRYIDKARDNMKEVMEYEANLVGADGSELTESDSNLILKSNTNDYHDTFAEDNPLNWEVDQDKIDDIADERD